MERKDSVETGRFPKKNITHPNKTVKQFFKGAVRSAGILGVRTVWFLGKAPGEHRVRACSPEEMKTAAPLCDGGFYSREDLMEGIADAVRRFQPDMVFGPDPFSRSECHADHLNVGAAVRQIACFAPYPGIMGRYLDAEAAAGNEKKEAPENPVPAGADVKAVGFYMTARPNRYVKTTGTLMKKQLEAVMAHRTQFPADSAELKSVWTYLRLRAVDFGLRRGHLRAEGFRVYGPVQMHCLPEAGE